MATVELHVVEGRDRRSRCAPTTTTATFLPGCGMLVHVVAVPRRGVRRVAAHARRLPRRFDDGDPARAPVGQPARPRGSTASGASASTCAASTSPIDGNGLPIHGNLRARRSAIQRLEPGRLRAEFDYGASPDEARGVPVPAPVEVDARLDERGLRLTTDRRRRRPTARYRSRSAGTRTSECPPVARARLGGAVADVRARRGRRAHHPDRRPHAAAGRTRADRRRTFDDHYALGRDRHFSVEAAGRALRLTFDAELPVRPAVRARRAGDFIAIEPMTATIDALGTRHDAAVRAGRPFRASFTIACGS